MKYFPSNSPVKVVREQQFFCWDILQLDHPQMAQSERQTTEPHSGHKKLVKYTMYARFMDYSRLIFILKLKCGWLCC